MVEAITTARVVHEIPGITHFERRKPVFRTASRELAPTTLAIGDLKREEIGEFVKVMHAGIDSQSELSEAEKVGIKDRRSEHFYLNALANPKSTVLVAKDKQGRIVGGLHGEESHGPEDMIDGHKIGYVLFVAKDPASKEKGVGQSLYGAYEEKLFGLGASFMMAAVDHTNQGSLVFHERAGMSYVYLEKTPALGETSANRWYFKKIGEVKGDLPVTEADYLTTELSMVSSVVSAAMFQEGLDSVDIQVIEGKSKGNEHLINIISPNGRARKDFEVIMGEVAKLERKANMLDIFAAATEAAQERVIRRSIIKD